MLSKTNLPESDNVLIEREKQKTKRQMMFYILVGLVASIGLLLVFRGTDGKRKVDIDLSSGKFTFSVDKPIVEQVKQSTETATLGGKKIDFTTGTIQSDVIQQVQEQNMQISPGAFAGKNLINKEGRYILTVEHPEKWDVSYNPEGLSNPLIPINTISNNFGNVNITRSEADPNYPFQTQVEMSMQLLLNYGLISQIPNIIYDDTRTTAFLTYTNQQTGGISYQKMTIKKGLLFFATANYNGTLTPTEEKNDMINMVASLTVIAD
ncbi:MAG: hypothetical protein ACOH2A_04210 [Sphingobacteriaceae bacterium]